MEWKCQAIKLNFASPLRIGEHGIGQEKALKGIIHSDTIWAAIVSAWAKIIGDPSPLCDQGRLSFRLSSAFPFVGSQYFLPKPLVFPVRWKENLDPSDLKELRKTPLIPKELFEKWINNEPLEARDIKEAKDSWEELHAKITFLLEPHVFLGRLGYISDFYYLSATRFGEDAGMYFLIDGQPNPDFFYVLNYLSEEGLGGERNRGFGLFHWEKVDFTLRIPSETNTWLLLSVFNPDIDDPEEKIKLPELSKAYYRMGIRMGWFLAQDGTQGVRSPLFFILEGSVIPWKPKGRIVDVSPKGLSLGHSIYRHGIAYSIPIKGEEV